MHTFFSQTEPQNNQLTLDTKNLHHLQKVLRVKNGENLKIATPSGKLYLVSYQDGDLIVTKELIPPAAPLPYHLYVALLKGDHLEWVLEKAVELNAASLTFVISQNTVAKEIKPNKWERLKNLVLEANKQCGRLEPLKINTPQALQKLVNLSTQEKGVQILLNETESGLTLEKALSQTKPPYHLWIGPEGGWDKNELLLMQQHNFVSATAGNIMLRAETAAIYAASVAQGKLI